jgi:hypothetical protein
VYGRDPPALILYTLGAAQVVAVDRQLQDRDIFLEEVRERLIQAQVTMKQYQDKSRREVQFAVRDWVWVRLNQRMAVGMTTATSSKLGPKFYGPYRVLQKVGEVSYKVQCPPYLLCSVPGSQRQLLSPLRTPKRQVHNTTGDL